MVFTKNLVAVCAGRDIDHAEARHDGRGRIRAVGGVRDDDLCPGRIAKEIRILMRSVAQRSGKRVSVEIVD